VGGQCHAPAALPPGKTRYPLYRRLGGLQSQSGQVQKILPSSGFDLWSIQLVASRYTDCTIPTRHTDYRCCWCRDSSGWLEKKPVPKIRFWKVVCCRHGCIKVNSSLYRPIQAHRVPKVLAPRFQDNRHMKVVRSALNTGPLYPPGSIPGTHFCLSLSRPQGHSAAGRI
jgi:hypothetical protein